MSRTRTAGLEMKVVLDTNALFNGSASNLLTLEVASLIRQHSQHNDLRIQWYLPSIVMHERIFQMRKEGRKLFPALQKWQQLLGYELGITEDELNLRVEHAVDNQVAQYNLNILNLDVTQVNWEQ